MAFTETGIARAPLRGAVRIIAFTGLPGSGKSVAVEAVRDRGVPVVRMGDLVLAEVRRRGLPVVEGSIGPVATGMRDEHGDDVWARRTIDAVRTGAVEGVDIDTRLVAIDGIRSLAEVERFRRDLGQDFHLVAVRAPDAQRHQRLLSRGREDDAGQQALVVQRDARERSWGIERAIDQADHVLDNDVDLETFRARVEGLVGRLLDDGAA